MDLCVLAASLNGREKAEKGRKTVINQAKFLNGSGRSFTEFSGLKRTKMKKERSDCQW